MSSLRLHGLFLILLDNRTAAIDVLERAFDLAAGLAEDLDVYLEERGDRPEVRARTLRMTRRAVPPKRSRGQDALK